MSHTEHLRAALQRFCDATACIPLPGQPVTTTMVQTLGMALSEASAVLQSLPTEPKDQTEWDRVYALIRHWSQRAQAAEDALSELVAVKTLKDDTEKLHFIGPNGEHGEGWKAVYDAQRAEYIRRQPAAWDSARDVLANVP